MLLSVRVIEARCLPAMDLNGLSDPYVRLQLGKQRGKTKVIRKNLNPVWDENFRFVVGDLGDELTVSVLDEDKYFSDDFVGQVKVPLWKVLDAENLTLGTAWYQLQPKNKKSKIKECGEIRLHISLSQKNSFDETSTIPKSYSDDVASNSDKSMELARESFSLPSNGHKEPSSDQIAEEIDPADSDKLNATSLVDRLFEFIGWRNVPVESSDSGDQVGEDQADEIQEITSKSETSDKQDEESSGVTFDELLKTIEAKGEVVEMPGNLPGGVVIDQYYAVSPSELNSMIFSPSSNFSRTLAEIQGNTGLETGSWKLENNGDSLKRVITYIKAATKLVRAVKATEEQTYLKADGKSYAVLASVSTPDVPFGSCFKTEVLYCITPGPESTTEEQSCHLVISWRTNFLQSTMMKGMIENGTRQGLKESYVHFTELLSQSFKPLDLKDMGGSNKEQMLSSLQTEQESDWKLAFRFFGNFTVISTFFVGLYVLTHILLSNPSAIQGLEFVGLDLPDSIGEVVVCGVLVLQGERVLKMIGRFLQARKQKGGDHGVKARGDGWILTVALIEGTNLAAVDSTGYSDPYVVFTCNGKAKTSSIKFQTLSPQWNEIFEFDAMDDPPSVMNIDVYDFDGPFDEATSLGQVEINFVRSNLSELADVWITLEGKLALACQSKLHMRIFLTNTRGAEIVTQYISKMEKEVGQKINLRSPQTNSAFQKIFGLPPEEFLINDFTCHLKRKMPMQGRLFLSPRIIGFYANLFGHKTKFFFLWEDIEDIQVVPPTLASMGSPSMIIILRKGRGMDAKHGAKSLDPDGKLKFHFQSFVSFSVANRTIVALWKARSLSIEQKMQIVEEDSEAKTLQSEESGSFLGIEDANMSEIFNSTIPVSIDSLMEIFEGGDLERRVMEKVGCVDYSITPWESVKSDAYQRQINYKFDKNLSRYGGEATSTQQKSTLADRKGWLIEEVMSLQGVLLGDFFNLHLRYQIEDIPKSNACNVQVSIGIAWLKSTKHQKRISKNIISNSSIRLKEMFRQVEKEFTTAK